MKKFLFTIVIFLLFSFNVNALTLTDGTIYPDLPNNEFKYYVILENNTIGNQKYLIASPDNFYFMQYLSSSYRDIHFNCIRKYKLAVSEEIYNENTISTRFYDTEEDKYYIFQGNISQADEENNVFYYKLNNDVWEIVSSIPINVKVLATPNIDIYYNEEYYNKGCYIQKAPFGIKPYKITFHLNGGIINDSITEDTYVHETYYNNLIDILNEINIKKQGMYFAGWYYDKALTLELNTSFLLIEDIDLYAKFIFKNYDDILNNLNFIDTTFNSNYEYAIISSNNNEQDIYLAFKGLNRIYGLEVYSYNEYTNIYSDNGKKLLTSIAVKNDWEMYNLTSKINLNGEYDVIVLRKIQLEKTINGEKITNYDFKVTENAHITYTNDLTNVVIMNDKQEEINTNLESNFDYSSEYVNNDENDLMSLFSNLAKEKNNKNVFSYFNQIWNYLKKSKIFSYIMLCMSGSLIIFIIKAAYRS